MLLKKIFKDYRLFEILILGVISGMPIAIIFSTLGVWLKESGIDIAVITTFAVARLSYSLKVFWSPLIDSFKVPLLSKFGHRKGWLILCSSLIALVLITMSSVKPSASLTLLYFLTIALGFLSATFDIAVDALRIDKFDQETQSLASATAVLGYRIGMLITGAGALYFTEITGDDWQATFLGMGIIFAIATIFIITVKEKELLREKINIISFTSWVYAVINPFKEFFTRKFAVTILLAVIFFKLGDAMLGAVASPFYIELGYTKGQIAVIVKFYGLLATLIGGFAGGIVMYRLGNFKGLIITGIAQSLTHFAFIWLNHQTPSFEALLVAISIENFACAMGATALTGYIGNLCNKKYSATQYALLSSAASLCNNTVTIYAGKLVNILGWDGFFILTIILALPGLAILVYLNKKVELS
ncbi:MULTISPECIES: AmpG family muropeptide MFS transporter [unclassified Rickettsia]|uniref:AmpG family muropeptide MFS transporter n=1 Tax=Rickettsia endosymbiont of Ceutorhynchus obstrictus TaxID=3066249 RepID=UPI00209F3922|nr:MFS transporter [Rickettsia endosymbiont of Ceutorhynchus assimilis]